MPPNSPEVVAMLPMPPAPAVTLILLPSAPALMFPMELPETSVNAAASEPVT